MYVHVRSVAVSLPVRCVCVCAGGGARVAGSSVLPAHHAGHQPCSCCATGAAQEVPARVHSALLCGEDHGRSGYGQRYVLCVVVHVVCIYVYTCF